jgi:hypothetical protein
MAKTKVITNGKLDMNGLKKIGKSFLITLGAAAIGFLGNLTGVIDFGSFNDLMVVALPWLANTLKVWLGSYELK